MALDITLEQDDFTLDDDAFTLDGDDLTLDDGSGSQRGDLADIDIEKEAAGEINETLAGFKERARNEDARREAAISADYWFCVYFQTEEQKLEFLDKIGWRDIDEVYLSGMEAADAVGIELKSLIPPMPQIRIDQKLASFAANMSAALTTALKPKKKKRIIIVDDDDGDD